MAKFVSLFLLCLSLFFGFSSMSLAAETDGAAVFEANCAGCHVNGGNIIRRGKTLKQRALKRNHVDSLEAVVQLVTNGKNNMSAYGDRLTPDEIESVSAYVLTQAENNWR